MHRSFPGHAEPDERRVEREGDERSDREPEPLSAGIDGDDADTGRISAQQFTQLIRLGHHRQPAEWTASRPMPTEERSVSESDMAAP